MPLNEAWLSFFFRILSNLVIVKPADNLRQNRRHARPRYFHFFPLQKIKKIHFRLNSGEFRRIRLNSGKIYEIWHVPSFFAGRDINTPPLTCERSYYVPAVTFYNTWTFMCERDLVWPQRYFFFMPDFRRIRLNSGNFRLNSGNFRLNSGEFAWIQATFAWIQARRKCACFSPEF